MCQFFIYFMIIQFKYLIEQSLELLIIQFCPANSLQSRTTLSKGLKNSIKYKVIYVSPAYLNMLAYWHQAGPGGA